MSSNRIIYQNWIADLGRDPGADPTAELTDPEPGSDSERLEEIKAAVASALRLLSDDEREFIERYYYMGRSCCEVAEQSGRDRHRLEALHQRALKKLQKILAPMVKRLYGFSVETAKGCPICSSPHRAEIDRLIASRDRKATWRPVMKELRERYHLGIVTPQTLIGHEKYH